MTLPNGEKAKFEPVQTDVKVISAQPEAKMPPAGPHARADLTNFDACPGSGVLPSPTELGHESDPGAG
jgi:hypothetical protein